MITRKQHIPDIEFKRFKALSGNSFEFYTGIYAINLETGQNVLKDVKTEAILRNLTDQEINKYLDEDDKFNTYALGFDPLIHYSSTFVKESKGSYNNFLRGIPLEIIMEMLFELGYGF